MLPDSSGIVLVQWPTLPRLMEVGGCSSRGEEFGTLLGAERKWPRFVSMLCQGRVCNCPQWSRVPTVVSVTSWSCCAGANSTATFPRYVVDKMRIQEDESMHCIAFRFDILTEYQSYPHAMLDAGNGRSDENPTGLVQALVPAVHHL